MKTLLSSLALVAVGAVAAPAFAGGYSPVVVEPAPAPIAVAPVAESNWQGAYGGLTLGYAFGGDDRVGVWQNGNELRDNIGNAKVHGLNGGLRVGYRWQREKWVVGPELSIEGGSVKDSFNSAVDGKVESKLKNLVSLKLKTGYEVQPNTLAYGIFGVNRGKFDYTMDGMKTSYNAQGYVFGLGVERKVSERVSVTGEIERNALKGKFIDFADGTSTKATPAFTNVKLGVNFKF